MRPTARRSGFQPYLAFAHNNLGNALKAQGKMEEAIVAYRDAIRIQPDAVPHYNLGIALNSRGKPDEAIGEFRTAIRLRPAYTEAHYFLARTLVLSPDRSRSDREKGLTHARKAVELAPKDGYGHATLALAEYRLGHWDASLAAGEKALAMPNGGDAFNLFTLALAHWQKGHKDCARDWFDKAEASPNENALEDADLRQLRTEAAELVGQTGPDETGAGSHAPCAVEGPR